MIKYNLGHHVESGLFSMQKLLIEDLVISKRKFKEDTAHNMFGSLFILFRLYGFGDIGIKGFGYL